MEVREWEDLKKKLCKELEEIKQAKKFDMGDIETIDKITHSLKSIDYIIENEDDGYSQAYRGGSRTGAYSQDGNWAAEGSYDGYNRGNSYARRGMHYVRGHYSRGGDELMERMEEMMNNGSVSMAERNTLEKAMEILRK